MPDSSSTNNLASNYRPDIDGLRAIAVIGVVSFHAFPGRITGGFIGVDIFFVISGFLISTIIYKNLDSGNFGLISFYTKRIRRIFPSLLIVLFSTLLAGWFIFLPPEFKNLGKEIAGGATFISNFINWQESGYFDKAAISKPLLHLWSLAIEEQFYIFWPLLLYLFHKTKIPLIIYCIIFTLLSFFLNMKSIVSNPVGVFYSPLTRFWELTIGSILGCILYSTALQLSIGSLLCITRIRLPIFKHISSIIGALFILIGIFYLSTNKPYPGWRALLPTIGTALLIYAGKDAVINRIFLSNKTLIFFGLISYPLYLWHWPILAFANTYIGQIPSAPIRIILLLASVVLAWGTYLVIEKPIRFSIYRKFTTVILVLLMLLSGFIGYLVYLDNGVSTRFPEPLRQYISLDTEDFEFAKYVRADLCHLHDPLNAIKTYPTACVIPGKNKLVLWGDSHAAALYPGIVKLNKKQEISVTQLTAPDCPPILYFNSPKNPNCLNLNKNALSVLVDLQPNILIMGSAWPIRYKNSFESNSYIDQLTYTLIYLKKSLPKTEIIIIGPMPEWPHGGPKALIFKKWISMGMVKEEVPLKLNATIYEQEDLYLNKMANSVGITYISPYKILCKNSECTSRVGANPLDLITVDSEHLSKSGSEYFINEVKETLFAPLNYRK